MGPVRRNNMNILRFENTDAVDVLGSSLQGRITATYDELVTRFGKPTYGKEHSGDGKVNAEWTLEFLVVEEGQSLDDAEYVIATIYDWKEMDTPDGPYLWHIGGFDRTSVDCVHEIMDMNAQEFSEVGVA